MRPFIFTLALLPAISLGTQPASENGDPQFTMITGHGVPVCEEYLELLNRTPVEQTPFCGRPENGPPPFLSLERRDLGVDDILPLFNYVFEFMRFDDQHHVEKFFHPQPDRSKSAWSTNATTPDGISQFLGLGWMHVWTYTSPVDISNDGKPVRLLVWQGYGVSTTGASCGGDSASTAWDDTYTPQLVFVLSTDGITIDEAQTRAIFGANGALRQPVNKAGLPPGATPFNSLADSIGIFGYKGHYYIQTENKPKSHGALPSPVKVFLREQGHTTQVCAFRPQNLPIPE